MGTCAITLLLAAASRCQGAHFPSEVELRPAASPAHSSNTFLPFYSIAPVKTSSLESVPLCRARPGLVSRVRHSSYSCTAAFAAWLLDAPCAVVAPSPGSMRVWRTVAPLLGCLPALDTRFPVRCSGGGGGRRIRLSPRPPRFCAPCALRPAFTTRARCQHLAPLLSPPDGRRSSLDVHPAPALTPCASRATSETSAGSARVARRAGHLRRLLSCAMAPGWSPTLDARAVRMRPPPLLLPFCTHGDTEGVVWRGWDARIPHAASETSAASYCAGHSQRAGVPRFHPAHACSLLSWGARRGRGTQRWSAGSGVSRGGPANNTLYLAAYVRVYLCGAYAAILSAGRGSPTPPESLVNPLDFITYTKITWASPKVPIIRNNMSESDSCYGRIRRT
ncbi:hypothetical protein FB451DRAFT_1535555 [Mycena latifolia]|nr:hypothetical protein FB451DRAFT_1535555 [Mycena latifolia]